MIRTIIKIKNLIIKTIGLNITVSFIFGIILTHLSVLATLLILIGFVISIYLSYMRRKILLSSVVIAMTAFLIGVFRMGEMQVSILTSTRVPNNSQVTVRGIVKEVKELNKFEQKLIVEPKEVLLMVDKSTVRIKYYTYMLTNKIDVYNKEEIGVGDEIILTGRITLPENFDNFNYSKYLQSQNISHILTVDKGCIFLTSKNTSIFKISKELRRYLSSSVDLHLPVIHANLLKGIVYGDTEGFDSEFKTALSRTGTTHIVAVSGFNITVLITIVNSVLLFLGRRLSTFLTIIFVCVFISIVGFSNVPVLRAGIMGIVLIIGRILGRKGTVLCMLSYTAALLIFENPLAFTQISFQLSFFSTVGLITFTNKISATIKWVPSVFREDLSSTLAALLATFPVTVCNFRTFSFISPLSNMLILPVVPVITILGFLYILLITIVPNIGALGTALLWLPLEYTIRLVKGLSELNFAVVSLEDGPGRILMYVLVAIYMLILSMLVPLKNNE
ncbi:MAG: ComEC/Rec2 family competence protein [Candidatus Dojkabacteria bacterium]|nr:ComEC/Rec2 family competence protein [Candidatus Dojkabacteria bacterium]